MQTDDTLCHHLTHFYVCLQLTLSLAHSEAIFKELECGPMLNVMATLLNIGGALCSTPQSLADAHY